MDLLNECPINESFSLYKLLLFLLFRVKLTKMKKENEKYMIQELF
jgi:hypothetical protein